MRAKGTVPVYVEVDSATNRRLRRTVKAKGWTVAQGVRAALADWLQRDPGADGHNNDGGQDGKEG